MRHFGFEVIPEEGLAEINDVDRFKSMYVLGASGTGKSTLLTNFIRHELDHCCIVIDPGGSFAKSVAALAPQDRLIFIDDDHPLCINLLNRPGIEVGRVAREFTQALNACIEATSSSPETSTLMRELVRNCARVLVEEGEKNIEFMAQVLNDTETRKMFKSLGLNPWGKDKNPRYDKYWADFDKMEPKPAPPQYMYREKRDSAKRVGARLSEFYDTDMMAKFTIGVNEFDVEKFAAEKKIVVFDMSRLDDDIQIFLGNLMIQAVKNYYMGKRNEGGPYVFVYVDEFHLLNVPHWPKVLTQSRKHNVSFTIAHQEFGQLTKQTLSAICGSVHTRVVFACGPDEADVMGRIYDLDLKELKNLDKYYAYVRIGNKNHKVLTDPPPKMPAWEPPPPREPKHTKANTEDAFEMMVETEEEAIIDPNDVE